MNILIVGCGYVGSAMARFWSQAGHIITATTTTPDKIAEIEPIVKKVVVVQGNDLDGLINVLPNQEVVLLSVGARNRQVYRETYLETAKTLVSALQQAPSVKQLIYTGSYAVLGNQQGEWATEDTPVAPANENGEILYETEQVLESIDSLKVCILRLAGIYGPRREILKIFRSVAGSTRPGSGQDFSNWVHLDDIVGAIELVRLKQLDGIYNLCNDVPLTTRDLLDSLCTRHNLPKVSCDTSLSSLRPYNVRLSNQKIKTAGYNFRYKETEL